MFLEVINHWKDVLFAADRGDLSSIVIRALAIATVLFFVRALFDLFAEDPELDDSPLPNHPKRSSTTGAERPAGDNSQISVSAAVPSPLKLAKPTVHAPIDMDPSSGATAPDVVRSANSFVDHVRWFFSRSSSISIEDKAEVPSETSISPGSSETTSLELAPETAPANVVLPDIVDVLDDEKDVAQPSVTIDTPRLLLRLRTDSPQEAMSDLEAFDRLVGSFENRLQKRLVIADFPLPQTKSSLQSEVTAHTLGNFLNGKTKYGLVLCREMSWNVDLIPHSRIEDSTPAQAIDDFVKSALSEYAEIVVFDRSERADRWLDLLRKAGYGVTDPRIHLTPVSAPLARPDHETTTSSTKTSLPRARSLSATSSTTEARLDDGLDKSL